MWAVLRMREATPLFRIFGSTLASFAGMMLSFDAIGFGRHGVSHRARTSSDNDVQGTSALGPGRVETFFVPPKTASNRARWTSTRPSEPIFAVSSLESIRAQPRAMLSDLNGHTARTT